MMIRPLTLACSLILGGCAMVHRSVAYPSEESDVLVEDRIHVQTIQWKDFYLWGILVPVFPFYTHPEPAVVRVDLGGGGECPLLLAKADTLSAFSEYGEGHCVFEWAVREPDSLHVIWKGKAHPIRFRREVEWEYVPFFFPTR